MRGAGRPLGELVEGTWGAWQEWHVNHRPSSHLAWEIKQVGVESVARFENPEGLLKTRGVVAIQSHLVGRHLRKTILGRLLHRVPFFAVLRLCTMDLLELPDDDDGMTLADVLMAPGYISSAAGDGQGNAAVDHFPPAFDEDVDHPQINFMPPEGLPKPQVEVTDTDQNPIG